VFVDLVIQHEIHTLNIDNVAFWVSKYFSTVSHNRKIF